MCLILELHFHFLRHTSNKMQIIKDISHIFLILKKKVSVVSSSGRIGLFCLLGPATGLLLQVIFIVSHAALNTLNENSHCPLAAPCMKGFPGAVKLSPRFWNCNLTWLIPSTLWVTSCVAGSRDPSSWIAFFPLLSDQCLCIYPSAGLQIIVPQDFCPRHHKFLSL